MARQVRRWRLEALESRDTPAAVWDGAGGGNWFDANNWAGDVLPTAADAVLIDLPAGQTVVINGNAVAASVAASANLTVADTRSLTVGGTVQVGGTFTLTGTLRDATVPAGTVVTAAGGTLQDVRLEGEAVVDGINNLNVSGPLELVGAVRFRGANGRVNFLTSSVVSGGGEFEFEDGSTGARLHAGVRGGQQTVVLDGVTVRGRDGAFTAHSTDEGDGFVNRGLIVSEEGGTITLSGYWQGQPAGVGPFIAGGGVLVLDANGIYEDGVLDVTGTFRLEGTLRNTTLITAPDVIAAGGTLENVRLEGEAVVGSEGILNVRGDLDLVGRLRFRGANGRVHFLTSSVVSGGGEFEFEDGSTGARLHAGVRGGQQTVVLDGVTVRGRDGAFTAHSTSEGDGFVNRGRIEVLGGTITLAGQWDGVAQGPAGVFDAGTGTLVLGSDGVYQGGTLAVAGKFELQGTVRGATTSATTIVTADGGTLDNVTVLGTLGVEGVKNPALST